MSFIAHIRADEKREEQTLKAHLQNTAKYAADNLKDIGLYHTGYLAGLLHDIGKYTQAYQKYIRDAAKGKDVVRGSVNHTFAGVIYLLEKYHHGKVSVEFIACEIIAYAIGSHHGVFNCVNLDGKSGFAHRLTKNKEEIEYNFALKSFLKDCAGEEEIEFYFKESVDEITKLYSNIREKYRKKTPVLYTIGILARMVLSALIDADRHDTAEFISGKAIMYQRGNKQIWKEQLAFMEKKNSLFPASPINDSRKYISDTCKEKAGEGEGIYRISVPTGAGKTLSTLRYALSHGESFNKKRIIFVIPLLSVLDQNSEVIKENIQDQDLVMEHHSNVVITYNEDEKLDKYELFSSTWESPVVITTLVQLLNTLFQANTTSIRRMHALENSIIIIDEIQSLPERVTYMFNLAMNFLAGYCNTTIVLSSATQPCFGSVCQPLLFAEKADIVPYKKEIWSSFKRTEIKYDKTGNKLTLGELAEFSINLMECKKSLLIVCNKKSTAAELFLLLKESEYKVYHLSTAMCMAHRQKALKEITQKLEEGKEKIICVSTQLVEAGVDFSFESAIRIKAGIDNLVQTAGRCNRNAEFGKICEVYLVTLLDEGLSHLAEIERAQKCLTEALVFYEKEPEKYNNDVLSDETIGLYYQRLFKELGDSYTFEYWKVIEGHKERLFQLLAGNKKNKDEKITGPLSLVQAFKTAGTYFSALENDTVDILVPYNEEAEKLINDLIGEHHKPSYNKMQEKISQASKYVVQIPRYAREKFDRAGLLLGNGDKHFLALDKRGYSMEIGITFKDNVEDWMK